MGTSLVSRVFLYAERGNEPVYEAKKKTINYVH